MITFSRRALTKQLHFMSMAVTMLGTKGTYYARGKDRPISFMTSAMQIVADRETPTRQ
jgi:hypothetical protein